jgi:predicted secreted hydrolase
MARLATLAAAGGWPCDVVASPPEAPPADGLRPLRFPADHGAHPDTGIEWWYVTGFLSLATEASPGASPSPDFGFQLTFFRSRTGLAAASPSRFAARQLVFAHAALTDLGHAGAPAALVHDERTAREGFGLAVTPGPDERPQVASLGDWSLSRLAPADDGTSRLLLHARTDAFALSLTLAGTQPLVLQGDAGWSRKGPRPNQASHYYSEPQLAATGTLARADARGGTGAAPRAVRGRAWLDHEWSDAYLPEDAVGWDWIGMNLFDGAALMAFRMRRADDGVVWAGGSWRAGAAAPVRTFEPGEVTFTPGRRWQSAASGAHYPVDWTLQTPAGTFTIHALLDDQELDSRGSTGSVYWEGLAELRDVQGRRVGLGYLEMTGRAGRQQM